jgi:prevent-host-death family protein
MTQRIPVSALEGPAARAVARAREHGSETVVTSRGEPVARIVPAAAVDIRMPEASSEGHTFGLARRIQVRGEPVSATIIASRR